MNKIQSIFEHFTDSTFSIADKKYKTKLHESFLRKRYELETNAYLAKLIPHLDDYSSDPFLEKTKDAFRNIIGKTGKYKDRETIGTHPDFKHLENSNDIEKHYIVSFFVDIKNSTSIFLKTNDLIWTKTFKNTVLRIITIFMQVFDGHVHRLQGDAVFGYFGWKDKCKEDAIIDSLNTASFLLWYVKNNLNPKLEELGYEPLKLRIGIDFGKDEDVIWSEYGLFPATEVTTTSLHTDLAAKLQSKAPSNTIMIGDNIKEFLDLPDEFITTKKYQKENELIEDKYILNNSIKKYKMWIFKYESYLKYFPILNSDPKFKMTCFTDSIQYFPNISALDKGKSLIFTVTHPLKISVRGTNNIRFEWKKINRGKEAKIVGQEGPLDVSIKRNNVAEESTAYRGHHVMSCRIINNGRTQETIKFGIFIK